ncbi:dihydrodipicolinate synthase family protein [Rhodococcus sovatensis]|uniref:Dihydrodipicolinate synthase family protein n=1 Tax=Rhodococcus sovatensis TaxID=1805840 RepID=A0ABZ2PMC9_9NOCA
MPPTLASTEEFKQQIAGVVGIAVTPFDSDGTSIDDEAFEVLIDRAVSAGLQNITPNGNTSEYFSLTASERLRSVELSRKTAPDALIISGIGEAITDVAHTAGAHLLAGADAFMVHQPIHPFWSVEGWIDVHKELARAHPGVPLVPYIKDRRLNAEAIVRLLDSVDEVAAIKYAIGDLEAFAYATAAVPEGRVTWICGLAENWAPYFSVGGTKGFTSGLVNVDPQRSLRISALLAEGDFASAIKEQREILEFEGMRAANSSQHNVSVVKEALHQLGLCNRTVRPPLSQLDATDGASVARIIEQWQIRGN